MPKNSTKLEFPVLAKFPITLVPFKKHHLSDTYIAWLNDDEVVRFSELRHHSHDRHTCEAYVNQMHREDHILWAIECNDRVPAHIGNIAAAIDTTNGVADLSILIGEKQAWNHGYGVCAWSLALQWLLTAGGMRKVLAGTMSTNTGMRSIMERSGMVEEGTWHNHRWFEGKPVDLVFAAMFKNDFMDFSHDT